MGVRRGRTAGSYDPRVADIEREDHLDDDSYQIRETFAQYGVAMYHAQVLEHGLVNVLTVAQTSSDSMGTRTLFDLNLDANQNVTMGKILHRLKPFVDGDADLIGALEGALGLRNHFAHHYWGDHDRDFLTVRGRELMIAESLSATATFQAVDTRLEPVLHRYFASVGVSAETLAELVRVEVDKRTQEALSLHDESTETQASQGVGEETAERRL